MARKIIDLDKLAKSEALKELARVVILAIIPVAIDSLNRGTLDIRTIAIVGIVAGLRAIEKFLYVAEKDNPVTDLLKFE